MSNRASQLLLAVAVVVLFCVANPAYAQSIDTNKYAVLAEGPEKGQGIDGLYPNVIPFWYAVYLVAGERIELYWVDGPITAIETWPLTECRLRAIRSLEDSLYYYRDTGGWSVLFRVVDDATDSDAAISDDPTSASQTRASVVCNFADRFVDRYLYFERTVTVTDSRQLPARAMPAIIELN